MYSFIHKRFMWKAHFKPELWYTRTFFKLLKKEPLYVDNEHQPSMLILQTCSLIACCFVHAPFWKDFRSAFWAIVCTKRGKSFKAEVTTNSENGRNALKQWFCLSEQSCNWLRKTVEQPERFLINARFKHLSWISVKKRNDRTPY